MSESMWIHRVSSFWDEANTHPHMILEKGEDYYHNTSVRWQPGKGSRRDLQDLFLCLMVVSWVFILLLKTKQKKPHVVKFKKDFHKKIMSLSLIKDCIYANSMYLRKNKYISKSNCSCEKTYAIVIRNSLYLYCMFCTWILFGLALLSLNSITKEKRMKG